MVKDQVLAQKKGFRSMVKARKDLEHDSMLIEKQKLKISILCIVHGRAYHSTERAPHLSKLCRPTSRVVHGLCSHTHGRARSQCLQLLFLRFHQARSCALQARPCAVPAAMISVVLTLKAHGLPCNALFTPFLGFRLAFGYKLSSHQTCYSSLNLGIFVTVVFH
jgi:hypothetical protein